MASMKKSDATKTKELILLTSDGPVVRDVSAEEARVCTPDEIPVIDLTGLWGDLKARQQLAQEVLEACENTGFFYVTNHRILQTTIDHALSKGTEFFCQSEKQKQLASMHQSQNMSGYYNHIKLAGRTLTGKKLNKEVFVIKYDPLFDPTVQDSSSIPEEVRNSLHSEQELWNRTRHLEGFQDAVVGYWKDCLNLARRLIKIFALALELPEDYFDHLVTFPGADMAIGLYPGWPEDENEYCADMGLNAHTDFQVFTLLWQDHHGGLEVLNQQNRWVKASPIDGTLVVNIGDFLMRLTNDRFKSTVHQVVPHGRGNRMSLAFFFGFNFNEKCSVVPTCTGPKNPAKYEPVVCGEYVRRRLAMAHPDATR